MASARALDASPRGVCVCDEDRVVRAGVTTLSSLPHPTSHTPHALFQPNPSPSPSPHLPPIPLNLTLHGLLVALKLQERNGKGAWDVCLRLQELGLLAKPTQKNVIRFAPPLTMTQEQLMECVDIIRRALSGF